MQDYDSTPELKSVVNKIRELMNELADMLATGGASSYEEYRYVIGQINGLALAERITLDVISKNLDAED